ncbi:MAG: DUF1878 family protein [Bacillota bacterium]|jgi:hypothetical protein|nr:DUF1878 family protein [Bacillota bacterium]MDP4154104.1 DUF1878 family protein [Bacillota bacterium]
MDERELLKRIRLLEYHQKLLLKLVNNPKLEFNKLIIEKGISEQEVKNFFKFCEELCKKMEEQKAEGFVYFSPLFDEFSTSLPLTFQPEEVIQACLSQNLFESLMLEFKKYI